VLAQQARYPKSKLTLEEEQIMFNTAVSSNSAYKVSTGFARRLLITVAAIALAPVAFAQSNGADGTPRPE
jgi:hypothetical protein